MLRRLLGLVGPIVPAPVRRGALFYRSFGRLPPRKPVYFFEKVNWRITHDRRAKLLVGGDKLEMKRYAFERVPGINIARVLWSGDDINEVLDTAFPGEWVVKPIAGSGRYAFGQGSPRESGITQSVLLGWRHRDLVRIAGEWIYSKGRPGFFIEERIPTDGLASLVEMKFFVFDDEVKLILVDHVVDGESRRRFYTPDWQPFDVTHGGKPLDAVRPAPGRLSEMLEIVLNLGSGFDFVRIDLFAAGESIWFGEISPYPASGLSAFSDLKFDHWLGSQWTLPSTRGVLRGT